MSRQRLSAGPSPADLERRHDALLVLDVDEVVLEFIDPFRALLEELGAELSPTSFKLTGNVHSAATGEALSGDRLADVTERLYREQATRQKVVKGAVPALRRLSAKADIVFLTAMTPTHHAVRRKLLDANGLDFPMIATERTKGGVVAELAGSRNGPVAFVDDLPPNLVSVARSAPKVHLVHLMANDVFRPHLPPLPAGAHAARDWPDATSIIERLLDACADESATVGRA